MSNLYEAEAPFFSERRGSHKNDLKDLLYTAYLKELEVIG